jgi:hypothetical protein
MIRHLPEQP